MGRVPVAQPLPAAVSPVWPPRRDRSRRARTVVAMPSSKPTDRSVPGHAGYRPELDGLRALSMMLVLSAHMGSSSFRYGFLGVDLFFVLSGYLITKLLLRSGLSGSLRPFYRRRFARLAPALLVMVVVVLALQLVGVWSFPRWAPLLAVMYLMNMVSWFRDDSVADPLTPTWSLASEEQYYLVWPLVLRAALARIGRRTAGLILLGVSAGLLVVQYLTFSLFPVDFLRHGPLFRPVGLLIGSGIALYGAVSARTAFAALLAVMPLVAAGVWSSNGMLISCASGALIVALNSRGRFSLAVTPILGHRLLAGIGKRSYSLYLWNLPSYMLAEHLLGPGPAAAAAGVTLTFVLGFASYRWVELPGKERFSVRRSA